MYAFLSQRIGQRWAYALTLIAYILLIILIILTISGPEAEFRYGRL